MYACPGQQCSHTGLISSCHCTVILYHSPPVTPHPDGSSSLLRTASCSAEVRPCIFPCCVHWVMSVLDHFVQEKTTMILYMIFQRSLYPGQATPNNSTNEDTNIPAPIDCMYRLCLVCMSLCRIAGFCIEVTPEQQNRGPTPPIPGKWRHMALDRTMTTSG